MIRRPRFPVDHIYAVVAAALVSVQLGLSHGVSSDQVSHPSSPLHQSHWRTTNRPRDRRSDVHSHDGQVEPKKTPVMGLTGGRQPDLARKPPHRLGQISLRADGA
ncbi:MAG: hypothetical protein VX589_11950 [Myxococcota bacterium]|nr:hypothetical protein [Myxococcota bacterium]